MIEKKVFHFVENPFTLKNGESVELIDELKNSIKDNLIHHKYVVDIYTGLPEQNNYLNKKYKVNKENAENALKNQDYFRYIDSHELPYKLNPLIEIFNNANIDDKIKAELLTYTWVLVENSSVNMKYWIKLFKYFAEKKELLMTEQELEFFNNLPEEITIYRGADSIEGISWTLCKEKAEWFAKRYNKNNKVFEKTVKKNDCLCYLNDRKEEEIIYLY